MTTARAMMVSAVLIALATAGAAWWSAAQIAGASRYQLVNAGGGATVRLDRQTGDLIGCFGKDCRALVQGEKIMPAPEDELNTIPEPPTGFKIDR